jgi:L-fucose dehydrogenase
MDLHTKDKGVLITGGAKGTGGAISKTCGLEDTIPVVVDREAEACQHLQEELRTHVFVDSGYMHLDRALTRQQ